MAEIVEAAKQVSRRREGKCPLRVFIDNHGFGLYPQ